jgi:hypothetical protein
VRALLVVAALALVRCGSSGFHEPGAQADEALRPDSPGSDDLFRFAPDDTVETFDSEGGSFRVHFTRAGTNRARPLDFDADGVPDFVQNVALTAEAVLGFYRDTLGFRVPPSDAALADNGGDGRFDIYLVDFGGRGDGNFQRDGCDGSPATCTGYLVQENDFSGYGYSSILEGIKVVTSHEFFHAVQAGYSATGSSVVSEGTAVWATEKFSPALDDFEGFVGGYLSNPDRPLDQPLPGPTDPFSYGAALFFQFLDERHGAQIIRELWERLPNEPSWTAALDAVLRGRHGSTFDAAFTEFARWNLFTGALADPLRSYARGMGYPTVKTKSVAAPVQLTSLRLFRASTQYFELAPGDRRAITAALVSTTDSESAAVQLVLASRRGDRWDPLVTLEDVASGTESIGTDGADSVVVAVVHTSRDATAAIRSGLCIGSVDEVAACRLALTTVDAPDAGPPSDAGSEPAAPDAGMDVAPPAAGCGCENAQFTAGISLLALAIRRSRSAATKQQRNEREPHG